MRKLFILAVCLLFLTAQAYQPPVQTLSAVPRIYLIENFLTEAECDHVISAAKDQLSRSAVVGYQSSGSGQIHPARTSRGMFFPSNPTDPVLRAIEERIADLTQIPVDHGEGLQILHYAVGGEYKPHYDYFNPYITGEAVHYYRGGQRIATVIMYLNNVDEGGETIFPYVKVSVNPVKGSALLFYNCTPDGRSDPYSLHGGSPVRKGEKWIATKWLRMGVFH